LLHLARLVYFCKSCLCKKSLLLTKHNKQALALETGLTGLAATNKYILRDQLTAVAAGLQKFHSAYEK